MGNLIVNDGQLIDKNTGQKVALEFGNAEQISTIKEHYRYLNDLTNEGFEVDPDYEVEVTASVQIKCLCGTNVYFNTSADDEDDVKCFVGMTKKCRNCKKEYGLFVDEQEDHVLVLCKLIKNNSDGNV